MAIAEAKPERIEIRTTPATKLDATRWQAFQEALDRPVVNKPRLAKLLAENSVLQ